VRWNLRDPKTRNLLLTLFLAGAGLYFFFGTEYIPFAWRPTAARIQALRGEYEKKSSDLARARQAVADLPRFQAEFEALHERYELAAELLPADRELPGLLRKITLAGQQAGVTFQQVRPEPPVGKDHYTELPVHITVRGGYHQIGQFLAQLANLERIVNVGTINISSFSAPDEDASCEAAFTASAYMMNPAAAAQAQAAQAQGGKKS
jgi:type IV pilus assembly protein PilO